MRFQAALGTEHVGINTHPTAYRLFLAERSFGKVGWALAAHALHTPRQPETKVSTGQVYVYPPFQAAFGTEQHVGINTRPTAYRLFFAKRSFGR